jgi:hypothetical protein
VEEPGAESAPIAQAAAAPEEPVLPLSDPPTGPFDRADIDAWDWLHRTFAAVVTKLDAELGLIFEELRKRGLDKSAAWLVTSDFGHPLGEPLSLSAPTSIPRATPSISDANAASSNPAPLLSQSTWIASASGGGATPPDRAARSATSAARISRPEIPSRSIQRDQNARSPSFSSAGKWPRTSR